jgi:thioredoxin-like negative regulator of GroEL
MSATSRIDAFRSLLATQPGHALARFGLATELAKLGQHDEAAEHFALYLQTHDDEGNGWMRYAETLHALGRTGEARTAIDTGIASADRHGHPGLVADLEALKESLD